jgi:gas vesicle protein
VRDDSGIGVIWFLAGMTIGAGAALLFAPQSGRATRRMIVRRGRQGRTALTEKGRDMMDYGRTLYDRGKELVDEASDLVDKGRELAKGSD